MTTKIKTALLGFGLSGRVFHLPFLLNNDSYDVKYILTSKEHESIKTTTDIDLILADSDIDLVINALPNTLHYSVSKKALLKNKHVLIEKPFVNELSEADDLIKIAKERNRVLSVFHNRRLDNDFITLKKLLAENKFGKVESFVSRFDRLSPKVKAGWRSEPLVGSGVYYDLAPHLLDQCLQLFGLPLEFKTNIETQRDKAVVDDFFEMNLKYPDFTATLTATCLMKEKTPRLQLKGENAEFISYELDPQEQLLKDQQVYNGKEWKEALTSMTSTLIEKGREEKIKREVSSYMQFFDNLAQAVEAEDPEQLLVKPSEAKMVMDILFQGFKTRDEFIKLK